MPSARPVASLAAANRPIAYARDSDILRIQLAAGPYGESEEVLDGVVIDFDPDGRIMAIEIDGASERARLEAVLGDASMLLDDSGPPLEIFTVGQIARQLRISPRTLQKTIQRMRDQGVEVGLNRGSTRTTILRGSDVDRIRQWRRSHRPGRPRARDAQDALPTGTIPTHE